MGLSEMALTGCVAEPLFALLVGLGCSMVRSALVAGGSITFSLSHHRQAILPFVGICLCLVVLLTFLIYNCVIKFKLRKGFSMVQLLTYALFFGIIITLTILFPKAER
jgi:Ca2+/Na+ antiporter